MIDLKVNKKQLALMLEGVTRMSIDLSSNAKAIKHIDSLLDLRNYLSEILANNIIGLESLELKQISEYDVSYKNNKTTITTSEISNNKNIVRLFVETVELIPKEQHDEKLRR